MLADLPFVIRALVASRRGASSTEYALVAALISILGILALVSMIFRQ